MKKVLLIIFLSLGTFTVTFGQSKSDKVYKLLDLLHSESTIEGILNEIKPQLVQKLNVRFEGQDTEKKKSEYNKFLTDLFQKVSKDLVKEDLYQTLNKYYSESELDTIIAFYETPVGQKTIKINAIIKESLTNALINKYLLDIKTQMIEKYKELN